MEAQEVNTATIEYRCALIDPRSHTLLGYRNGDQYRLPRIRVARTARFAQQVQKEVKMQCRVNIFVLAIWIAHDCNGGCAIAERMVLEKPQGFSEIAIDCLPCSELGKEERHRIELLFDGEMNKPSSRIGWIDEALFWMSSATGRVLSSKETIEQWNSGDGFILLRASSDDGQRYWLKATGDSNSHELAVTSALCELCPKSLPKLISIKKEWNAWLTKDAGMPLPTLPVEAELRSAAISFDDLQLQTVGHIDRLLAVGAFDQRLPKLRNSIDAVFDFLIEAMKRQTSTKAVPLSRNRLLELAEILRDACFHLESLEFPDTLIHNDLNNGNILWKGTRCVFIDWSEAAIGNPFLACERLCQLNGAFADTVRRAYRESWLPRISADRIDKAIALAPLVAIYAYLFGRGHWPKEAQTVKPAFESYARSLARHMDRAAKHPVVSELLCR